MTLEILPGKFSVCQVQPNTPLPLEKPFCFVGKTDRELSLVCLTEDVPETAAREDGWRGFRVEGTLDFSLIGILAGIAGLLAKGGIPIFALSTFDTDYILVKEEKLPAALELLRAGGYTLKGARA